MNTQGGLPVAVRFFLILFLINAGFFYWLFPLRPPLLKGVNAESNEVIINELAWMGTTVSANAEWIELKNLTGTDINLDGWQLIAADGQPSISLSGMIAADSYYLLERTNDNTVPDIVADLIYTGALGNSGEVLELKNSLGEVMDSVDATGGWPAGDNINKTTMARDENSPDIVWGNSSAVGGTPKAINDYINGQNGEIMPVCGNGILETNEQCDDGNNSNNDGCDSVCKIENIVSDQEPAATSSASSSSADSVRKNKLGDVVINEFVSDPGDNDTEWVELYNTKNEEINLTGWTIEDGGGAKTILSGNVSSSKKFFLIEKPKGSLNNAGDIIILRDKHGVLIDQVAYGNWNDGNADNNAPVASDPNAVARKIDGHNTFNNANDFAVTISLTKGSSNIINNPEADEISDEDKALYDLSDDIIISEIFPNPIGADNDQEFIELFNSGQRDVNLSGWGLGNSRGQEYKITALDEIQPIIKANSYYAFLRSRSKLVLNNNQDSVKLFQPLKTSPQQTVKYKDVIEGQSYNIILDKNNYKIATWAWSETVTPGVENIVKAKNHPPVVSFAGTATVKVKTPVIFDGSDIYDVDGDKLSYSWDFGDGIKSNLVSPEHTFLMVGNYTVKLIVSDGQAEIKEEKIIRVVADSSVTDTILETDGTVWINELMPNPLGSDADGEWIELYNWGDVKINLLDWRLDDGEIGDPYTFAENFWLDTGKYLVLKRQETDLALNNDTDILTLFNNADKIIDKVTYKNVSEGSAYARGQDKKWYWTIKPTPGLVNIISSAAVKASAKSKKSTAKSIASNASNVIETTLEKVKEFEAGDNIRVSGVVAVLPDVLASQFFYIVGSPGLQIYNYKKDFPKLAVGDYIIVAGELSVVNGEYRLKTKSAGDIKIIERRAEPQPAELTCDKITEDTTGCLVTVNGEVTDIKGPTIYLDDGTSETMVYIKKNTGVATSQFKIGKTVSVAGVVGRTSSGVRIMPRSPADIVIKDISDSGKVLGETAVSDEWTIAQRDKKIELFKYLLIIAGAIIIVLIIFMIKYKKEKGGRDSGPSAIG